MGSPLSFLCWKLLQKVKIPYKWLVLLVLREPVLTHDKLKWREIHMVSRCYLCGQSVEAVPSVPTK